MHGILTSMDPIVGSHSPENIDHEILADSPFYENKRIPQKGKIPCNKNSLAQSNIGKL